MGGERRSDGEGLTEIRESVEGGREDGGCVIGSEVPGLLESWSTIIGDGIKVGDDVGGTGILFLKIGRKRKERVDPRCVRVLVL